MTTLIGEIVAIGDELTSGQRLDTNSQWLAGQLGDLGVQVRYHSSVGDDLAPMCQVLAAAAARADVVVCTGGLGPTADDLTRDALANVAGVELIRDEHALDHIRGLYAARAREMPERNVIQAMFPAGSGVIPNPHGTAPGIDLKLGRSDRKTARVFALPGVPAEMKQMWSQSVGPTIEQLIPVEHRRTVRHRLIKCFGVGESDLEAMLPDLIRRDHYPRVGITVSKATITLRVTTAEADEAACLNVMEPTLKLIRDCLGELVFGDEADELQHAVARLLLKRDQTLCSVESYTQGLLANWLSALPESKQFYHGAAILPQMPAHSEADATQIAREQRASSKADFALVISSENHQRDQEHGEVYIAAAGEDFALARTARTIGHPEIRRPRIAKAALDLLRKYLFKGQ